MSGNSDRNEGENNNQTSPARLNLNALPSLTTWLFCFITGVILAAVVAGLRQNLSAVGLIVVAGVVVLPVFDFLRNTEKDLYSMRLLGSNKVDLPPSLAKEFEEAAKDLGLRHIPRIIIAPYSVAPLTLGTWRRAILIVGKTQIENLETLSVEDRRALWLHEIAHFVNGDNWKVRFSRSLLRVSIVFMAWSAFFILGIVLLTYLYGMEIFQEDFLDSLGLDPTIHTILASFWPDPALMAPMLDKAKAVDLDLISLYVLDAHLPFVFSGFILLIYAWRKLHLARELYADTRVAARIGNIQDTIQALTNVSNETALVISESSKRKRNWIAELSRSFNELFPFQLKWPLRKNSLEDPIQIFGSWKSIGSISGLTVLLLDLILIGPFTLSYVGAWPAHLTTVAGFVILALWMLPMICQGYPIKKITSQAAGAALVLVGIRAVWLMINIVLVIALLFLSPASVGGYLNMFVLLGAKVLTVPSELPVQGDPVNLAAQTIGGDCSFTVLALLCILGGLLLAAVLLRRLLTWYGFSTNGKGLIHTGYIVILVIALVLGLVVLPPLTTLIQGDWTSFLHPTSLILSGLAAASALAWGLWFGRMDHRYARLCPNCNEKANGRFELGKRCEKCGQVLHPWLLANY